jgi:ECF transporter S component (folate family)
METSNMYEKADAVSLRKMLLAAFFLASSIALNVFEIKLPFLQIGIGFVAIALSGWILGFAYTAVVACLSDIIAVLINPAGGAYFPGFTLSAFLNAAIYALLLHNVTIYRKDSNKNATLVAKTGIPFTLQFIVRVVLVATLTSICVDLLLNTYWLTIILGKGWIPLFFSRLLKELIYLPLKVVVLLAIIPILKPAVDKVLPSKTREK